MREEADVDRLILSAVLLYLFALVVPPLAGATAPYHVHLSWEHEPSRSVTVTWRTDTVGESIVEYGPDESYGFSVTGATGSVHSVRLLNLTPSTTYYYRCGDDSSWSEGYSFKTGPEDLTAGFRFAVIGDDRGNYDVRRSIGLSILEAGAEFVIHTGDLVNDGRVQQNWDQWFESGKELYSTTPVMPALGNHEEMAPQYFEQMALPGNEQWYSFDYGNAHFVALNTESSMVGEQLDFLRKDLAQSNSIWKFVFFHRPMYSSGYHGSDLSVRRAWEEVLAEHGVDVVFSGHDHIYERTMSVLGGQAAEGGIVHLVSGGGGAGLHDLDPVQPGWSAVRLSEHHYLVVGVKEAALRIEARLPDGTTFDQISLDKSDYPDLQAVSIETEPEYPSPGQPAKVLVRVANLGSAASGDFLTRITISGSYSDVQSPSLGVGEEKLLVIDWIPPDEERRMDIGVKVDPNDAVNEGLGESNNDLSMFLYVTEPKPDLAVSRLSCDPAPPDPGQATEIVVEVVNIGNQPSGTFQVTLSLNGTLNHTIDVQGLAEGEFGSLKVPWTSLAGEWRVSVEVDSEGKITEIREDNNVAHKWLHVQQLVRSGRAYVPSGAPDDGQSVVYYDAGNGPLAGSSAVIIIWGINGWQRPSEGLASSSTLTLSRAFETTMERFDGDLFVSLLPSGPGIEWVDIKFSDRHLFPSAVDDNAGESWRILGREWAEARLDELIEAQTDAVAAGANVSAYLGTIDAVRQLLSTGDYLGMADIVGDVTVRLRELEALATLDTATLEYSKAVEEGLDLARTGLYLDAARAELEKGNLLRSKQLSLQVLRLIEEARAEIGELAASALFALAFAAAARGRHGDE